MIDKESILKLTQNYDVISFDVFDTLIIRDVMVPADIFTITYGKLGRYMRIISEFIARHKSYDGEVSLEDIDKQCPFSCFKELETEKKYCRANPVMLEIYNELKKSGKKMYAISDMYLSSAFISDLLHNLGFDLPVLVSCEEHCNKKTGELFKVFLTKYSYSSASVLHIGDNAEADCNGAKIAGIDSFLIEKHINMLSYSKINSNNFELVNFINHGINEIDDDIEKIGYEIVGPIVLAFCQWIHKQYKDLGFDKLFFLARDMHFAYDIYNELYDDSTAYLCVSRKSFKFSSSNPDEICKYLMKEKCYGNVAVVDTGWIGNAQVEINRYSKKIDSKSDIGGLYLGSKLAYRILKRSTNSRICLFASAHDQFKCQLFTGFMETLIGSNEPQVVSYKDGLPVFDRSENRDRTNLIKQGAKKFIDLWAEEKGNKEICPLYVKKPFERLFYNPQRAHIVSIGLFHYEDYEDSPIVCYDDGINYLFHPGILLKDLNKSSWKGAFFKKMGIIYPFILALYYIFGSLRLLLNDLKVTKNI